MARMDTEIAYVRSNLPQVAHLNNEQLKPLIDHALTNANGGPHLPLVLKAAEELGFVQRP